MIVNVTGLGRLYLNHFYKCDQCGVVHVSPVKLTEWPPYRCLNCNWQLKYMQTDAVKKERETNAFRIATPDDTGKCIDYQMLVRYRTI